MLRIIRWRIAESIQVTTIPPLGQIINAKPLLTQRKYQIHSDQTLQAIHTTSASPQLQPQSIGCLASQRICGKTKGPPRVQTAAASIC